MISEQGQQEINQVMNHILEVANHLASMKWANMRTSNHGVAAMLGNEAMERWKISGDIAKFLTCEDAVVHRGPTSKSGMTTGTLADFNTVVPLDGQTIEVLTNIVANAWKRNEYKVGIFMSAILNTYKKEYGELLRISNELTAIAKDPGGFILYDKWLLEEYKE